MSDAEKARRILEAVKIYKDQAKKGYASDKELVAAVTRIVSTTVETVFEESEFAREYRRRGNEGGLCGTFGCKSLDAVYFHHGNQRWYCKGCATANNRLPSNAHWLKTAGHPLVTLGKTPPKQVSSDDDYSNLSSSPTP